MPNNARVRYVSCLKYNLFLIMMILLLSVYDFVHTSLAGPPGQRDYMYIVHAHMYIMYVIVQNSLYTTLGIGYSLHMLGPGVGGGGVVPLSKGSKSDYHIAGHFRWCKISWICLPTLRKKFLWF